MVKCWWVLLMSVVWQCYSLDNGLGLTPQMGYSTWNDVGSEVSEAHVKAVTRYLASSGLAAKGFVHVNVDEGWMLGRDAKTLEPIEDMSRFPSGMKGLGQWIHNQSIPGKKEVFKYGLYTSRGVHQCARPEYQKRCLHTPPNPANGCEGTNGYEKTDGLWMVEAGADYLKEDSCGGSQDHKTAFNDYSKMRDVLNSTKRPVFFSLCGWHDWYAPPDPSLKYLGGYSLGNSWRIYGDGKTWAALNGAINTMAYIYNYTGPGGWNDPDLLIGPKCHIQGVKCGQTDLQARTQFSLWSIFPAPLIISQGLLNWTGYALETYSNEEVIRINQDPLGKAARRIAGGNLTYPCQNSSEAHHVDGCTNVWGRQLIDQGVALAMINNGAKAVNVSCGIKCFEKLSQFMRKDKYIVHDLWQHKDVGNLVRDTSGTFSFTALVPSDGGHRLFKLRVHTETGV